VGSGGLACAANAITCVEVSTGTASSALPITFGQPFKAGAVQANQGLVATDSSGASVPLQMDEVTSHRDGSLRFAVLSAKVSNLAANQPKLINLFAGAKSSATQTIPASPDWNLELEAKVYNGSTLVSTLVAKPQDLLKQQIAQGSGRRLNGSVATEYTVVAPFKDSASNAEHPHLSARLHTRLYDGGASIRTDMVLENNWTFKANPGNLTYELTVRRNGQVVHTQPRLTHNYQARWHKVLWTGNTLPQYRVRHHMPYFLASKATWNYDLSLRIPDSVLADEARVLASSNTAPMGPAMLVPYFPTTGGRSEIGPQPRWTALYLITQDDRARASMLANADAAAGVPVHYRDEGSGQPLDVERNPNVAVRFGSSTPKLPTPTGTTIYTPDTAHQASFGYMPYLITGDAFYLDEAMFWASWNIAAVDPYYREGAKGLIYGNEERAQSWALRSIDEASRIVPDNHPMKSYFQTRLANNLNWYVQNYPQNANAAARSPFGAIKSPWDTKKAGPWQNDFMTLVLTQIAEDGDPQGRTMLNWITGFTVGRFLNEANGFCMAKAPGYWWDVTDASNQFFSSWKTLFDTNYAGSKGASCAGMAITEGSPDRVDDYAAYARAMLAATSSAGVTGASGAYTKWKSMTPKMDAGYVNDPTWAIVPR